MPKDAYEWQETAINVFEEKKTGIVQATTGSGKSFMASKLAEEFNLKSFDLDQMIEKKYNLTINDIFAKYGEDFFRKAEREMLEKVCGIDEVFILATGGGTPIDGSTSNGT